MNSMPERDYLVALLSKIMLAEGTESELDDAIDELKQISPISEVTDLIFYPEREMSAEEIADIILNYKPKAIR
jgi:hypothetical protein